MATARRWTATLWFDPSCPATWLTSRWLLEVAKVRQVTVGWRLMSLSVLNEGRADDPEGDPHGYLWVPVRICTAVRERYGQDALARFYTALWTTGSGDWLGDLRAALAHAGLPAQLADVGGTTDYDDLVRASHATAVSLVGEHVGTPVIEVEDSAGERVAFFGPVLTEIPTGERAARLWDGVLQVASTAGFRELQA